MPERKAWLDGLMGPWFADRVLEVDEMVLIIWRHVMEERRQPNRTVTARDLRMVAIALAPGGGMVTRNKREVSVYGVPVLNFFDRLT